MLRKYLLSSCFLFISIIVFGQKSTTKKLYSTFHLTTVHADSEFSQLGGQYKLDYQFSKKVGLQLALNGHRWSKMDLLAVAAQLGPTFQLIQFNQSRIALYATAGPELLVGNDYAGFFGRTAIGIQVSPDSTKRKGIDFGLGWGQSMTFHPGHFSWIRFFVGYRF